MQKKKKKKQKTKNKKKTKKKNKEGYQENLPKMEEYAVYVRGQGGRWEP